MLEVVVALKTIVEAESNLAQCRALQPQESCRIPAPCNILILHRKFCVGQFSYFAIPSVVFIIDAGDEFPILLILSRLYPDDTLR